MTLKNCWKVTGPLPPRSPRVRVTPQTVVAGPVKISSLDIPRKTGLLSGDCGPCSPPADRPSAGGPGRPPGHACAGPSHTGMSPREPGLRQAAQRDVAPGHALSLRNADWVCGRVAGSFSCPLYTFTSL